MATNVITITALNKYVKTLLERDSVLTDIALCGEISNFTNHYKTGHYYFSLKDEQSAVKAVMFRSDAVKLAFMPENGMKVIVQCRISLFERDGSFQVYVQHMVPDGIGAMQLAFEQLKNKLEKEGLFEAEHKKMLPAVPKRVGLVTSKTGAALQDIINVTKRRYPAVKLVLAGVTVQGEHAATEIASAITTLDKSKLVDVIIVARGGGSKEDLWVFNNEKIARATFACETPVVSAIGHEIDFSILDFVADLRAPTPSAAAEIVMPDIVGLQKEIYTIFTNIQQNMQNRVQICYNTIYENIKVIKTQMQLNLQSMQQFVYHSAQLCDTLSPVKVLTRGYAIARGANGVIKQTGQVAKNENIQVQVSDGTIHCVVQSVEGNISE